MCLYGRHGKTRIIHDISLLYGCMHVYVCMCAYVCVCVYDVCVCLCMFVCVYVYGRDHTLVSGFYDRENKTDKNNNEKLTQLCGL